MSMASHFTIHKLNLIFWLQMEEKHFVEYPVLVIVSEKKG